MAQEPTDLQSSRDTILIVKGRFKAVSQNLYGQFILIFRNQNNFESYNAVISTFSDLFNLEPHEEWTKYRELIANVKWKGNYNTTMTTSIMDHFKKFAEEMNSISIMYRHVAEYDYNAMEAMLFDLMKRIVQDKNLVLETAIQEVLQSDYTAATTDAAVEEKDEIDVADQDDGFKVEEDAVILPVKPIVAPIKGKPIFELRIGDRLMIIIDPRSDRANYFIDQLDLRENNEIKPTPAEVIDIKAGYGKNNPTDILTLISKGIYGKFTEAEKQIKLRVYDPEIDGKLAARKKTAASGGKETVKKAAETDQPGFSKGTIVMLALFMIILVLFVVLIFLSW